MLKLDLFLRSPIPFFKDGNQIVKCSEEITSRFSQSIISLLHSEMFKHMLTTCSVEILSILEGIWTKSMVHHFWGEGTFYTPENIQQCLETVFIGTTGKVPCCTSIWWLNPGMLLNIAQCTRQLPTGKNQPKALIVTKSRNHDEMTTMESSLILSFSKGMGEKNNQVMDMI